MISHHCRSRAVSTDYCSTMTAGRPRKKTGQILESDLELADCHPNAALAAEPPLQGDLAACVVEEWFENEMVMMSMASE